MDLERPFCTQVGHTGPLRPSETGRPIPYIDQVAIDFPELVIVGGHIGYPWTTEMIAVADKHPKVAAGPPPNLSPPASSAPAPTSRWTCATSTGRVKQYLKEGRALRIETVVNKPSDIGIRGRLEHLPELAAKARAVNGRLLTMERAGQGCAIGSALFERIHQPYIREGQGTGALR